MDHETTIIVTSTIRPLRVVLDDAADRSRCQEPCAKLPAATKPYSSAFVEERSRTMMTSPSLIQQPSRKNAHVKIYGKKPIRLEHATSVCAIIRTSRSVTCLRRA
jgi:hypothetical protein